MENILIIVVILAAVAGGAVHAIRHFRGRGGCGGGGSLRLRRKKLPSVRYRKTFRVEGMHCEHCRTRVEEVLNDIRGISARVSLRRGEAVVSYGEPMPDEVIRARVERTGYRIVG